MTHPVSINSSRREIYSHTGLRGIAAICVFLTHMYIGLAKDWQLDYHVFRFFDFASPAVDLFFILSGFILNWVYLSNSKSINWSSYLKARVGRILPLYYVTTILSLPTLIYSYLKHGFQFIGDHNWIAIGVSNLLMVSGIIGLVSINGPAWSISVEFFCYLAVFPLLIALNRFLSVNRYSWFLSILLACIFTKLLILSNHFDCISIYHWHWQCHWIARGVFGFSIGFLICTIYRMPSVWKPSSAVINLIVLGSFAVFLLTRIGYLPVHLLLYVFPFLVYFTAFDAGVSAYFLKLNPLQWLGERSYSLYLWHVPVLSFFPFVSRSVCTHFFKTSSPLGFPNCFVLVAIVLFISDLSYRFFETPCRDYIRTLGNKRHSPSKNI